MTEKVGGKAVAGSLVMFNDCFSGGFSSDFLEPATTVSSSRLALYYNLNYLSVLKVTAFLCLALMVVAQLNLPCSVLPGVGSSTTQETPTFSSLFKIN